MSPGHVFVVRGDLTRFGCDAWLLPSDAHRYLVPSWWGNRALAPLFERHGCWGAHAPPSTLPRLEGRALALDPGPAPADVPGAGPRRARPVPVLTRMGAGPGASTAWFVDGVRNFVEVALAEIGARGRALPGRARPLLAVPLVGTGHGGLRHHAGEVADALMGVLRDEAETRGVDLALVTWDARAFAGAQAARSGAAFDGLPAPLVERARALAAKAAAGQLVVFLGAGVSAGVGLPLWSELLSGLARRAGLVPDEAPGSQWRHFGALGPLDQAEYLAARLRAEGGLGRAVVESMRAFDVYGLAHGLVAGLPIAEAITTNYDQLFEAACAAAGRPCAVLPYSPGAEHDRWLLKMHGCLSRPEDIVLTRESYLRYAERNAALAGIVQAMLITRHMLYLGFGLGDDNFLRIVDAVRRAMGAPIEPPKPGADAPLGTAVMLEDNPLLRTLWRDELEWLCTGDTQPETGAVDRAEAARRVEVFLDCLSFHATAPAHLLDNRFAPLRTPEDDTLARLLDPFTRVARNDPVRRAAAWPMVEALIRRLGGSMP